MENLGVKIILDGSPWTGNIAIEGGYKKNEFY